MWLWTIALAGATTRVALPAGTDTAGWSDAAARTGVELAASEPDVLVTATLAAGAAGWASGSVVWGLVLVPLGMLIGPPMGLLFPFPVATKVAYAAGLVLAVALGVVGVRHRARAWGAVAIVAAVVLWAVLGFLGLGTGT